MQSGSSGCRPRFCGGAKVGLALVGGVGIPPDAPCRLTQYPGHPDPGVSWGATSWGGHRPDSLVSALVRRRGALNTDFRGPGSSKSVLVGHRDDRGLYRFALGIPTLMDMRHRRRRAAARWRVGYVDFPVLLAIGRVETTPLGQTPFLRQGQTSFFRLARNRFPGWVRTHFSG